MLSFIAVICHLMLALVIAIAIAITTIFCSCSSRVEDSDLYFRWFAAIFLFLIRPHAIRPRIIVLNISPGRSWRLIFFTAIIFSVIMRVIIWNIFLVLGALLEKSLIDGASRFLKSQFNDGLVIIIPAGDIIFFIIICKVIILLEITFVENQNGKSFCALDDRVDIVLRWHGIFWTCKVTIRILIWTRLKVLSICVLGRFCRGIHFRLWSSLWWNLQIYWLVSR